MATPARAEQHEILAHPLSYVRAERGWTYQDLVTVLARRVGNMAARREKAWRWEHWGVVPDDDTQHALAAELDVSVETVRALGWPAWLPVGERPQVELPWTAESCLVTLHRTAGAAMVDRRGFLVLSAGTAATVAEQWLGLEPARLTAAQRGGQVDPALVDCFEQRLRTFGQLEMSLDSAGFRALVGTELRAVTDLLEQASYTQRLGERLVAVAAQLGRAAGWSSFMCGYHAAAERYWLAALRASHLAGDRSNGALILMEMSLQRVESDRPTEALALASAARESGEHGPRRLVAALTVREARHHAVLGQTSDCERLLTAADTAMGHGDDYESPYWGGGAFAHADHCAQVATSYLALGHHQAADRWLGQSLDLQPTPLVKGGRAWNLMYRTEAALGLGEVEQACALLGQAVPLIAAVPSDRFHRRLSDLHTRVRQHRDVPAVAALDEQVRTLIA